MTPLREAVRTLASEGLVVLDPQRGAWVAHVSLAEAVEVYELRLLVEPYAFRLSLESGDPAWRASVAEAWKGLERVQSRRVRSPLDLEPQHTSFHLALVSGCGSGDLVHLVARLATRALRFRTLAAPSRPGGNRRSLAEHRRLAALARSGEPRAGARFLARHLAWPLATALGPNTLERTRKRLALLDGEALVAGLDELTATRGSRGRAHA